MSNAAAGQISNNNVAAVSTALSIGEVFTGTINDNDFTGAAVGVAYQAAAPLSANRIHDNTTGLTSTVSDPTAALGFLAGSALNQIFHNVTGVSLTSATMEDQYIFENQTGVSGSGSLVPSDLSVANIIENNNTGVAFSGPIEFNRIDRNVIGIQATSHQLIAHNDIYGNTQVALEIDGRTEVSVVNNTFYSPVGDLIRIEGSSQQVEILNNILWAQGGVDLYVANDSQSGFFSDYNDLYSSSAGHLVSWDGIVFNDILDWQQDVHLFDLDSIGTTVVNPLWAQPRFVDLADNDFRVFDQLAGLRFSSPTINNSDPITNEALPSSFNNLLLNANFAKACRRLDCHRG